MKIEILYSSSSYLAVDSDPDRSTTVDSIEL